MVKWKFQKAKDVKPVIQIPISISHFPKTIKMPVKVIKNEWKFQKAKDVIELELKNSSQAAWTSWFIN